MYGQSWKPQAIKELEERAADGDAIFSVEALFSLRRSKHYWM
jgi:hypothetical protein